MAWPSHRTQAKVEILTASNFDASISSSDCAMISFYAPWCGHCKQMLPVWERLSEREDCLIAKVDATEQRALAARFGVNGYPSIFHIEKGGKKVRQYASSRTLESFDRFLNGEWLEVKPLSYFASPYGPIGTVKGLLIRSGGNVLNSYSLLIDAGFSPVMAAVLLVFGGVAIIFCCVIIALLVEGDGGGHAHRA